MGKTRVGCDDDRWRWPLAVAHEAITGVSEGGETRRHLAVEALALDGQAQPAAVPVEQYQPQVFLQPPDSLGDGRLGGSLGLRGGGHGAEPGRGLEGDQRLHGSGVGVHRQKM